MAVLLTGAAGFIGYHVSVALLARGEEVVGVDNLNPYYDPALKRARLARLEAQPGFTFMEADIADREAVSGLVRQHRGSVTDVVHLAAQAGVRHSIEAPFDYVESNLSGHMVMLEACRHQLPRLRHLVYASSSSVYGGNTKVPFAESDPVERPVSLYATTKRANELMSHCYAHLYGIASTGLRFFTVYGPWGRPDMAAWLFAAAIAEGRPIRLYNRGEMERDFTHVDDIVRGVLAALERPPAAAPGPPHRVFNLGNHQPVALRRFVAIIEQAMGRAAEIELAPLPPGDVVRTFADIEAARRELGWEPTVAIEDGLAGFVAWFRDHHGV